MIYPLASATCIRRFQGPEPAVPTSLPPSPQHYCPDIGKEQGVPWHIRAGVGQVEEL